MGFRRGVKEHKYIAVMSSILTNSSAMIALETLKGVNKGLHNVQNQIATGEKVSNAKNNAAVYAISTVMRSDISSFHAISNNLSLGAATIGVARAASEQVVDLLTEIKTHIISAQEENTDRAKINTDITALKSSIENIVDAAQFNGKNLLKGIGSLDVLATLNRGTAGEVTAQKITANHKNLELSDVIPPAPFTSGEAGFITLSAPSVSNGNSITATFTAGKISEGDEFAIRLPTAFTSAVYTAQAGDTLADVGAFIANTLDTTLFQFTVSFTPNTDPTGTDSVITITNNSPLTRGVIQSALSAETPAGSLNALKDLSVTTQAEAGSALGAIDAFITTAIDAAATFGSAQKSIEIQSKFINTLTDAMEIGVSTLKDVDMEEASARLQSLQVQQQLSVQALSIANQAPQSLLSLFR